MPARKSELSRPSRLAHRLIKLANACNSAAELMAEMTVVLQDTSQACVRLAEELEEREKERLRKQKQ